VSDRPGPLPQIVIDPPPSQEELEYAKIRTDCDKRFVLWMVNDGICRTPTDFVIQFEPTKSIDYEEVLKSLHQGGYLSRARGEYRIAPRGRAILGELYQPARGIAEGSSHRLPRRQNPSPLNVFISYSHKDRTVFNQLEVHLKLLERHGLIHSWHFRRVGAGQEWTKQISNNLERADIVVLLVSADFLASDYCYDVEIIRALERHDSGEAVVVPVIVRDVDWSDTPFARLQPLPSNGRALKRWADRDGGWRNVIEGIKVVAEGLQQPSEKQRKRKSKKP
jgi:internalin A